ncbi:MAG: type II toxin-antitoxin system HicA family toxin [Candidatus Firestonebacteria bacterium]|nr:type II toxin-antitoxin system HicA family toxin [Candidatus Firestonebacteria bacterium]
MKINSIPASKLGKVFEKAGFKCVRIEGDHFVYTKPGVIRPVVIPNWKEVPVFIIKNNLRTAGITREEYFSLLEKI